MSDASALEKPNPKRVEELRQYRLRLAWEYKNAQVKADALKNQLAGVDMVLSVVDPSIMPRK
jgi:hypothetical protein